VLKKWPTERKKERQEVRKRDRKTDRRTEEHLGPKGNRLEGVGKLKSKLN
jgi:hypothetical protein